MRTRGFDLSRRMVKTFGWRCGVFLGKRGFVGLAAFFSRNEQETKQNEKEEKHVPPHLVLLLLLSGYLTIAQKLSAIQFRGHLDAEGKRM